MQGHRPSNISILGCQAEQLSIQSCSKWMMTVGCNSDNLDLPFEGLVLYPLCNAL